MKKLLSALVVLAVGSIASAHGVEKIVPADAHNFRIESVSIDPYAISSHDTYCGNDGCLSEFTYEDRLAVLVRYESKDDTDAPKTGSGSNFEFTRYDSHDPMILWYIHLPANVLASVKANPTLVASLIDATPVVRDIQTRVDDPKYQSQCRYDNDSNRKLDDNCHEHIPKVVVPARIVTFNLNF